MITNQQQGNGSSAAAAAVFPFFSSMPTTATSTATTSAVTSLLSAVASATNLLNSQDSMHHYEPLNSAQIMGNTGSVLDLIMCRLVAPFHVLNDPRVLQCGASACLSCIVSQREPATDKLKCAYCNDVHRVPADVKQLPENRAVQHFIKSNERAALNNSFSKQLEDSMFKLEQKIHNQNLSMEHFEQYLSLVEKDVRDKVDSMKNHLEKYGEQFIENLKLIHKEVQKQWLQNSGINTSSSSYNNNYSNGSIANNNHQTSKDKAFHLANSLNGSQFQYSNNNNHVNNHNNDTTTKHKTSSNQYNNSSKQNNNNNAYLNTGANNNHNNNSMNSSHLDPSSYNYSNSSSWIANDDEDDDDLDDLDANDMSYLKNGGNNGTHAGPKKHLNKEQAQFNKFVREEVARKFGEDFLMQHEVNQLDTAIMNIIRDEAIATYLPKDTPPARAWTLAKVSLRSLKRDTRRKQIVPTKKHTHSIHRLNNNQHHHINVQHGSHHNNNHHHIDHNKNGTYYSS